MAVSGLVRIEPTAITIEYSVLANAVEAGIEMNSIVIFEISIN